MFKAVLLLVVGLLSISCYSQPNHFIGGIFFNANGIHIEEGHDQFWQNSDGIIWGGGGLSAGLLVKHYLYKRSYFNLELRYIQKGSVYEFLDQYNSRSFEVLRLNYIEFPLSIGYEYIPNRRSYFIETGLAVGRLFSSKVKLNELAYRTGIANAEPFKDYDISWVSTLKFPLNKKGKENLLFGLRFSYSLFTIHEYYKLKNMVYGVQLDYLFNN